MRAGAAEAAAGQEGVRDGDAGEVVVQAAVAAALEVIQPEALLELAVVVLDAPPELGQRREPDSWAVGGQVGEPVLDRLVALAKLRWRIEHDYRELKQCLGLDHYEGRSYRGLHHHLTCVTVAHAFLTCCRLSRAGPPAARPQTAAA